MEEDIKRVLIKNFDEGYEAFAEGISKYENPYEPGSLNFEKWESGWEISKEDYYEYLSSQSPLRPEDFNNFN